MEQSQQRHSEQILLKTQLIMFVWTQYSGAEPSPKVQDPMGYSKEEFGHLASRSNCQVAGNKPPCRSCQCKKRKRAMIVHGFLFCRSSLDGDTSARHGTLRSLPKGLCRPTEQLRSAVTHVPHQDRPLTLRATGRTTEDGGGVGRKRSEETYLRFLFHWFVYVCGSNMK